MSAVVPAVWSDLLTGERSWGDSTRLVTAWDAITAGIPGAQTDPAEGLASLAEDWGLVPERGQVQCPAQELTERVISRWALGAPHLADVPASAVRRVIQRAVA